MKEAGPFSAAADVLVAMTGAASSAADGLMLVPVLPSDRPLSWRQCSGGSTSSRQAASLFEVRPTRAPSSVRLRRVNIPGQHPCVFGFTFQACVFNKSSFQF